MCVFINVYVYVNHCDNTRVSLIFMTHYNQQIAKEIDNISWRSKIVAVKHEIEESKREYYKDLMKTFYAEVPTFLDVGNIQYIDALIQQ